MKLKATNGTIYVYDDRVVVSSKGIAAISTQGGFQGDKLYIIKT